ncbi:MAG: polyribonucleotide nucleotidyltransferase, partial [Candidatus Parcubacteria bacterium]
LFDYRIRRDLQVVMTVLAYDPENEPEFVGLIAASAAIAISSVPWNGPVGGVRVAKIGNEIVVNPDATKQSDPSCVFEAFVSGPKGKINMIELSGGEASEEDVAKAFAVAQEANDALIAFQEKIVAEVGKEKHAVNLHEPDAELKKAIDEYLASRLQEAVFEPVKQEQFHKMAAVKKGLFEHIAAALPEANMTIVEHVYEDAVDALVHRNALENGKRPDGRGFTEVRPLEGEVKLFERTHGSAVFARGSTQALAVTTLAAPGAEQLIETMETTGKRRFMLHYNFPPYSTGETGRLGGPGRREIGHGALAEKALRRLVPTSAEFPYTIRVVSEILSSNGSSSMATVCATCLSLFDAGVPLKKMVAGIAMGLMSNDTTFKVLTDLQGPEDFYGDMDFKVAGTRDGVTAIQLDTKVRGISMEIVRATLAQAKVARMQILDFMKTVLPEPRKELSKYVPAITQLSIDPSKIGMLIGPGGKTINGLIAKYALASINVDDDGSVFVAGEDPASVASAAADIKAMTREFKVGEIIEGRVIKTLDFGAIIDLGGGKDGKAHVSELREGFVKQVTDVVNVGDFVRAKIIRADEDGRIGLSIKQLNAEEKAKG